MKRPSVPGRFLIGLVRAYQRTLSPLLGPRCRFYPSCSAYMIEAIERKGVLRGVPKGFWRLLRCNVFNPGGYDPVEPGAEPQSRPDPPSRQTRSSEK